MGDRGGRSYLTCTSVCPLLQTGRLWRLLSTVRPWQSITAEQIEQAVREVGRGFYHSKPSSPLQVKKKFGEVVERCSALAEESTDLTATQRDNTERLAAQHSLLTFLRRQIEHLKSNCF